jgi:hypothetical protein
VTTYIVACDYNEYWIPIAAANDKTTSKSIMEAASQHVIEKLRARHVEMSADEPFNEADAAVIAADAIIIAPSQPPFVEKGTPMLPDEVLRELDQQISEFDLLGGWI